MSHNYNLRKRNITENELTSMNETPTNLPPKRQKPSVPPSRGIPPLPDGPKKTEEPKPIIRINFKPMGPPFTKDDDRDPLKHFMNMLNNRDGRNSDSEDSDDSDNNSNVSETESEKEDNTKYPFEFISKKVESIQDLLDLGKMYDPKKKVRYNFDLKRLANLVEPLTKLKNTIGMDLVKKTIVNHVVYYLQDFHVGQDDMLHTVIQGPPGVGKTMLGRILGEIYYGLGVIPGNKKKKNSKEKFTFKIVKRSDLIGKYLGHTAAKTQQVIDEAQGGILFIDEAYSLGNQEQRDSFAKECIDTINQNLSENKGKFICIIAGYKDSLDKCFFAYNEGLRRRFSFTYTIEPYKAVELRAIFMKMVSDIGWTLAEDVGVEFFEKNYSSFKYYGGDMESLLFNCKLEHSKRVFGTTNTKKLFSKEDMDAGFKVFVFNRKDSKGSETWKSSFV
jgi:SpoVK/Ycf46/Vps4 family AAA+-type ATPase